MVCSESLSRRPSILSGDGKIESRVGRPGVEFALHLPPAFISALFRRIMIFVILQPKA